MFEGRYTETNRKINLATSVRREKKTRVFSAALGEGETPDYEAAKKLADRFFQGMSREEKRPTEYSLLATLLIFIVAFYIVWPSFMKHLDIQKQMDQVYVPGGGAASMKALTQKQQQRKRVVRQEMIPQLYPDLKEVQITPDEIQELDVDYHFDDLATDGSTGMMDTGFGDGYGGPVLNAGVGDVPEPVLIYRVEPDYPDEARRSRVDGFVLLEAIVNKRGDVVNIKVLQSPPAKYGFAEKAREAVEQWKFKPAIYKGQPVNVRIRFSVEFSLLYY